MEYKITVMKNAFYAQSGGVTAVINCSAYGVISKFKKNFLESDIYASKNGIVGLLEGELYDLSKTKKPLENLLDLPVIMTEKDAVKCEFLDDNFWYLKIEAQISEGMEQKIIEQIKS